MGFDPKNVGDVVMVACGRHCAICHRFCGIKMELHHIRHANDGGNDSIDNCIPLCFDCHSDMRSYDHNHPKGRKYTEKELKLHRDNWYSKCAATGGVIANEKHVELDRHVFARIVEGLPFDPLIRYLKDRYPGQPYLQRHFRVLDFFAYQSNDPFHEFLDVDLEGLRLDLLEHVDALLVKVGLVTFPAHGSEQNEFATELKYSDSSKYSEVIMEVATLDLAVVASYEALVRAARRKLSVDAN